jgi:uncharacterized protein with HEPN domain
MATRSPIARLTDIVEAIEHVQDVLRDKPLEAFEADWQARWLVERGIEIVSEASRRLPDDMKARHHCSDHVGLGTRRSAAARQGLPRGIGHRTGSRAARQLGPRPAMATRAFRR